MSSVLLRSLFNVQPTLDFVESKVPVSLTWPGALDASRVGRISAPLFLLNEPQG